LEQILIISLVALCASLLTFFSGFGLGTLLLPAFGFFFPIETAIVATGIVHLSNNLFKLLLTGKNIRYGILLRFGLPSVAGAFAGAFLLREISHWQPFAVYTIGGSVHEIHPIKLGIAILMIIFSLIELIPALSRWQAPTSWMIPGGMVSGFFGGLSGHQGALRSMFLVKLVQKKEAYIATGTAIACMVDLTRLPVYFSSNSFSLLQVSPEVIIIPILAAFAGALGGNYLLKKITLHFIQKLVAFGIILFAGFLGSGVL